MELTLTQRNDFQATTNFHSLCLQIVSWLYPSLTLESLDIDPTIEYRCDSNIVLKELRWLLPFGWTLDNAQVSHITITRSEDLTKACEAQVLYWYLACAANWPNERPVQNLAIVKEDDHFWFHFVPTYQEPIRRRLLDSFPVFYLEHFLLNLEFIQLTFDKVRLVTVNNENQTPGFPPSYCFVSIPGRLYHLEWSTNIWTTSIISQDPLFVNPAVDHTTPPASPSRPDFFNFIGEEVDNGPISYYTPTHTPPLPPSEPDTDFFMADYVTVRNLDTTGPHQRTTQNFPACWCNSEICICTFCPNIPPTPPTVHLWHTGAWTLPSFSWTSWIQNYPFYLNCVLIFLSCFVVVPILM